MEDGPDLEPTPELRELMSSPEQAFDSDLKSANREFERLMERLQKTGKIYKSGGRAIFKTTETAQGRPPAIQIAWSERNNIYTVLRLSPHVEGKGAEAGVFGYSGEYGVARQKGKNWEYDLEPLSELYGIPDDLNIIVKPTATRWAIGKDETAITFGDDTRTLYMGLGFLLLGQEWMHIGMHEAGHLPDTHDENKAWRVANKYYADLHKLRKEDIVSGKSNSLFELLEKSQPYGNKLTIGQIVQYGLVSHASAGNAKIPKSWEQKSRSIMIDFTRVIERADQAYDHFIGR